jgi:pre-mRNA-processing factor 19
MYCAISGEVPMEPVVSRKTGHLFEKRLIEKALQASDNQCPVTGEELKPEDLLPVACDLAQRPRPLSATSLPAMMAMFQNEWDDLVVESHATRRQLHATRRELSHALYQHDAACRVIARLTKERDDALALARSGAGVVVTQQVDAAALEAAYATLGDYWKATSKTRKKRKAPAQLATAAQIKAWAPQPTKKALGSAAGVVHDVATGASLVWGPQGVAYCASAAKPKVVQKASTGACFVPHVGMAACGANTVTVYDDTLKETSTIAVQDVSSIDSHATGKYCVAMKTSGRWSLVSLEASAVLAESQADTGDRATSAIKVHPDGMIVAGAVSTNGAHRVKVWEVRDQKLVHAFDGHAAPITSVAFSENGYHLASCDAAGGVKLWDLRKLKELKSFDVAGPCTSLGFDSSGKYLAVGTESAIVVREVKPWTEVVSVARGVAGLAFAADARALVGVDAGGGLAEVAK